MKGGGGVALASSQGSQGGHALLHIELVGHRMGRLEEAGKAGEVLKFHRGGAAAGDGGVHPAPDGVFLQGVEEGGGVLRGAEGIEEGQIAKGLVHNDDDVHWLGVRVPLAAGVGRHQFQYCVLGVALRFVHRGVAQGNGEVEQEAVALGDPLLGVDVQGGEHAGAEEGVAVAACYRPQEQGEGQLHRAPSFLGDTEEEQEEVGR